MSIRFLNLSSQQEPDNATIVFIFFNSPKTKTMNDLQHSKNFKLSEFTASGVKVSVYPCSNAAIFSSHTASVWSNVLSWALSISITAVTLPLPMMGTTISLLETEEQAM